MDKAILVIDMPSCCNDCSLVFSDNHGWWCPVRINDGEEIDVYKDYVEFHKKPDWCPLKPVPKQIKVNYGSDEQDWEKGYNSCLEEILDA